MKINKNGFYMCYVFGMQGPTFRHPTYESANDEATRLARTNPNVKVFILMTTDCLEHKTIYKHSCVIDDDDDLPF